MKYLGEIFSPQYIVGLFNTSVCTWKTKQLLFLSKISYLKLSLWAFLNLHVLLVAQISSCNLSGFVRDLFTLCFLNRTLGNHKQVFPKLIKSKLLDSELLTLPQKGQNFLIPLKPISPSFTKDSLLLKKKMTPKYHLC